MSNYSLQNLGRTHEEHIQTAIDKASRDKAFRTDLLCRPNETLSAFTGLEIPPGFKIRFIENNGAALTVVLPDLQDEHAGELSDAALDVIAGGGDAWLDMPSPGGCSADSYKG